MDIVPVSPGVAADSIRAKITSLIDAAGSDLVVDVFVSAMGNSDDNEFGFET